MAGTVIEWYEFFIYGTAAALVFSVTFFPNGGNPLDAVLAAFLTYAIGFIARPLGGFVFGQLGDRFGRKKMLQVSLIMIGVATFLMGCLPDFSVWGYAAPIALAALRFIQGFAVGGEWGGAVLLVGEHSPPEQRGYWASYPQAAASVGNVLATIVLLGSNFLLSEEAFLAWGWRIAFWLSAVVVFIGYYIRKKVEDAPIFKEALKSQEENSHASTGLRTVITQYPKQLAVATAVRIGENAMYYLIIAFTLTYLTIFDAMTSQDVLLIMFIANIVQFFSMIFGGYLSDQIGRRKTYLIGGVLALVWAPFYFPLLNTGSFIIILFAVIFGLVVQSFMYGPEGALFGELFPTRARYAGVSAAYQLGSILGGSLAPIIAVFLWNTFDSWIPIAIYLFTLLAFSIFSMVYGVKETSGTLLEDVDEEDFDKHIRSSAPAVETVTERPTVKSRTL
ncbi:MFS transporter [Corynebacterium halotolerans]|uniref:Major facilitator superfamily protein n=1 Tax=Corynebacterium halotolerans YIM 70093 = DSM 44683 TaxID=1121362 RepID=M1P348_9CORY|nr:MFS transporter [Corynebacterium halotolerans]AGF71106.1 major facilitator superfamily protein [Corynebacterium halotolerans YIM 70093 = DSM 44683]